MSLRWRLALVLAALGAIAVGLGTLTAWVSTSRELHDEVDQFLRARAGEVVEGRRSPPGRGGPGGPGGGPPGVPGPSATFSPDVATQLLDEDGSVEASVGVALPVDDEDRAVAQAGGTQQLHTVTVDGTDHRVITAHLPSGGAVQIARDLSETQDVLTALAGRLLLITLGGAALAGLVGWLVAGRITGPVRRLADTAERVAETQDLSTPIEVDRTDEVGRLGRAFNAMLGALRSSREQQQQLVQDASHELRTPLTSLRTSAELLERGAGLDGAERERLLHVIAAESKELSDLVGELVELATEQRGGDQPMVEVRLDEVVERAVEQCRHRTGRAVELSAEPVLVAGNAALLERVVRNLLDNADKFSPAGAPVEVAVAGGRVTVRDHGPGIPPADRERVFDRFYRADATRTLPGSGLGLAIVAQVVQAHGGRAWAGEAPGGGAEVGFEVPPVPSTGT